MRLYLFLLFTGAVLSGCGSSDWTINQAKFYKYQNHDVPEESPTGGMEFL